MCPPRVIIWVSGKARRGRRREEREMMPGVGC
jgi:hypothetical protein